MTKREIAAILKESVFKPSDTTGMLRVILEANNTDYFYRRAMECMKMARASDNPVFILEQLTLAISLLAVVKSDVQNMKSE